ncbi:unnamed protein product [Dovyalis caffra]|uniref:Uncharacterized protein n=1 Tax=Dovyalis caffra TaxID=77055 RepID=A0AAV1SG12_9ROSI|nr:unnamed protein product [Dovyalis caffra]
MSGSFHCFYYLQSKIQTKQQELLTLVPPPRPRVSCLSLSSPHVKGLSLRFARVLRDGHKINVRCSSSTGPGGPGSDDSDSKSVLDAFFLGKALAEAINERVESAVGEFFSTIGRLQAEQQKQIQDFQPLDLVQEDVLERAKKSKDQAAREAMVGQGIISESTTVDTTSVNHGVSQPPSPSAKKGSNPANKDPALGVSSDD